MANMMEKIGDKLHMGGHKKEKPHTVGGAHAPHYVAPLGYDSRWQSDALYRPHGSRYCCSNYLQCLRFLWSQSCKLVFHKSNSVTNIQETLSVRATMQIVSLHQGPRQDPTCTKPAWVHNGSFEIFQGMLAKGLEPNDFVLSSLLKASSGNKAAVMELLDCRGGKV
ncbi:hypothetical protein GOP47_0024861 [Adiantum capillus-veneris]|uniref:Uncharacterized protein n=1 Tax=Adiantum capillus-veneris TaxID=13818 RepID=A0A9D4U2K2_ADICA|nr:hypothetical protein GOP47_0024861 [Adiantum capillus-veneris]